MRQKVQGRVTERERFVIVRAWQRMRQVTTSVFIVVHNILHTQPLNSTTQYQPFSTENFAHHAEQLNLTIFLKISLPFSLICHLTNSFARIIHIVPQESR